MIALPEMNNHRLHQLICKVAQVVEGEEGYWQINYEGRDLWVITDASHNRMRIMTPVVDEAKLSNEDCRKVLEANFDRALDAKYAVARGCLWSVFMHPLNDLSDALFLAALTQVKELADNYGTTYSSGHLVFGDGD